MRLYRESSPNEHYFENIMNTAELEANQLTPADLLTALKSFFVLSEKWNLTTDQQMTLLGNPSRSTFFKWKKDGGNIPKDTIERLSHILTIHKCLSILTTEENLKNKFLLSPNSYFGGDRPIDILLGGRMFDLIRVRQYLDMQRGG